MRFVYIHGLGQNASSWDKTIAFFSNHSESHCPDLAAMLCHREATYTNLYGAFADEINAVPGMINLCGLSLGAILAMNFAIDHPDKVQSIVLIGAQYKMPKLLLRMQNLIFHVVPKTSFAKQGFEKADFIKLTNSMTDLDFGPRLKDIACPALILCGEKDSANQKAAITISEQILHAKYQCVEGAGHEVNVDTPEKLAVILEDFYRDQAIPVL